MREILYRGKDIAGNWHYGVPLVFTESYVCITAPHTYNKKVEANTVGQFTGLTDKNGTKIFEGDIMRYAYSNQKSACVVKFGKFNCDCGECMCGWYLDGGNGGFFNDNLFGFEVIGNIHDNPELLGGDN